MPGSFVVSGPPAFQLSHDPAGFVYLRTNIGDRYSAIVKLGHRAIAIEIEATNQARRDREPKPAISNHMRK